MKKRVFIECAWCKKTIEVTPSQAKKRRHCNYKCNGDAMSYKTRFKGKIPKDYYHMEKREGVVCSYREFIDTRGTEFRWMDKEIAIEFVKNNPNTMIKQKFMKFNDNINKNKYEVCITNNKSKKSIFVKPLHRYWRKELQRMD